MCLEYILRKLRCHRAHSGTYCSTLWTWEKCHRAIGYKNSSRRVLNSPFLHGQIPLSQRKQEGLPGSSTHSTCILSLSSFLFLHCHVPLSQNKSIVKGKENLSPWHPGRESMLAGKKENCSPIPHHGLAWLSRGFAQIPTFLQFHTVFWPHHNTEWYLTPGVSTLWEKDSDDVAWAQQVSAWSNKPQDLKRLYLHNISMLRFVLSVSKSMVFLHPWQFSSSKTVTANKNYLRSFQLCNKWECCFKTFHALT